MATGDWLAGTVLTGDPLSSYTGGDLVGSARESGWSGVGDHIAKWDPILLGPIIEGIRKTDEASAREAALGDAPKFEIPSNYDQYMNVMKERAGQQMPGYDAMSQDIQEAAAANATGVAQLSSGPEAVMGMDAVYGDQASQLRDLGMRASQWQNQAELGYQQAQYGRGALEQQQFEYNEWLPWQIKKNEIASMRNAGNQMAAGGTDGMGAGAVNIVSASTSNVGKS